MSLSPARQSFSQSFGVDLVVIPKFQEVGRMLTVADYELIRRRHFVDGQSGRAIAEELGHSRKTVTAEKQHAERNQQEACTLA
jgi:hypothetical protein